MSATASSSRKKPKIAVGAGYRKGEQTRQRILDAALKAFGKASFKVVTTRQIAEAADVSLPTLQYYFGDKEGLYRACAEAIVARYRDHTASAATHARVALNEGCAPEEARGHLKAVVGALARFLVGSKEAERWAPFVSRELRDPGPAFEILYENLWRPGIEIAAQLITGVEGGPPDDAHVRALLLTSSLLAFQPGRSISLRIMRWSKIGPDELRTVLAVLDTQIDAIGR